MRFEKLIDLETVEPINLRKKTAYDIVIITLWRRHWKPYAIWRLLKQYKADISKSTVYNRCRHYDSMNNNGYLDRIQDLEDYFEEI
jgi:hypothetical protein